MSGSSRLKERLEELKAENETYNYNNTNMQITIATMKAKLEKIKEIVTDKLNLKFDITDKLREIKDIIEGE